MSTDFNNDLVERARSSLAAALAGDTSDMDKSAFAPGAGIAQAPAGAPPMDPAMAGGAPPPMDPAAAGGAMPPMDPAMMGGAPPMDPAAMGGAPPAPPMPPEGGPPQDGGMGGQAIQVSVDDLLTLFTQIAGDVGGKGGGGGGAPNEASPDMAQVLSDITDRLVSIEEKLGGGAAAGAPGEAGAMPPMDPAMLEAAMGGGAMPPEAMGVGMPPMPEATAAPMPEGMPVAAAFAGPQSNLGGARKIGDLVAALRSKK